MDLKKTQFLFERGAFGSSLRTFKRRRKFVLFDAEKKPKRLIEWEHWIKLKETWPDHVKNDGLTVRTVWVLEEVK